MNIKDVALQMYPFWILGATVLACTAWAGYKNVIRVEKQAVLYFLRFLAIVTFWRYVVYTMVPQFHFMHDAVKNISIIPWPLTLTVFWEDACHGLPLFLLRKAIGAKKWLMPLYYLALGTVMLEFGLGHLYQGILAAAALSFYIPYSIKLGEKYGFGTVMVCHTLFDFTTILSVKLLLGS